MKERLHGKQTALWSIIVAYIGVLYATGSLAARIRKGLTEVYGYGVFDWVVWVLAAAVVALAGYCLVGLKGKRLLGALITLALVGAAYRYLLGNMEYAVEKIHFIEYGALGIMLHAAFHRHFSRTPAMLIALSVVFWVGLGDETLQWALPDRVGEIRDALINLLSGGLGIVAVAFTVYAGKTTRALSVSQLRTIICSAGISAVLCCVFLWRVHGFGHVIELKDPGRIFSSFTGRGLRRIDKAMRVGDPVAVAKRRIYENEAARHLHQREFYFDNVFKGSDGTLYRRLDKSYYEQRILEEYYEGFLRTYGSKPASGVLQDIDPDVAEQTPRNVMWSDSLRQWPASTIEPTNRIYESRVKSTIITSFSASDLLFYLIVTMCVLGYAWVRVGARGGPD